MGHDFPTAGTTENTGLHCPRLNFQLLCITLIQYLYFADYLMENFGGKNHNRKYLQYLTLLHFSQWCWKTNHVYHCGNLQTCLREQFTDCCLLRPLWWLQKCWREDRSNCDWLRVRCHAKMSLQIPAFFSCLFLGSFLAPFSSEASPNFINYLSSSFLPSSQLLPTGNITSSF